jgi:ketosteroid isomerase-like protein
MTSIAIASSTTAVELVQNLYAAFGRGDIAYILEHIAPDCTWVAPGEGIPNAGVYRGPEGAGEFFRRLAASEQVTAFEPREYFSDGQGNVVALGSEACTSLLTGKQAKTNWAMVFRIRDGKVTTWESYYDTAAYYLAHQK